MRSALWLAWSAQAPPPESVHPGVVGSLVVLALAVVTGLLVWSFSRQLRKVDFDDGSGRSPASDRAADDDPSAPR